MIALFVFVAALLNVSCADIKFKDCGSAKAKLNNVNIDPCTASPCPLPRGKEATILITFTPSESLLSFSLAQQIVYIDLLSLSFHVYADEDVVSGKATVYGKLAGIPVPFPLPNNDLCSFVVNDSGATSCPLKAGTQYTYKAQLPVKSEYPKVTKSFIHYLSLAQG